MRAIIFLLMATSLLAGCANLLNPGAYSTATQSQCKNTEVLMANLTLPLAQQQYVLPNGQPCSVSEVGND